MNESQWTIDFGLVRFRVRSDQSESRIELNQNPNASEFNSASFSA